MRISQLLLAANTLLLIQITGHISAVAAPTEASVTETSNVTELYLEVYINGEPVNMVAAARKHSDGTISMPADQLKGIGIQAPISSAKDISYIRLSTLEGIQYRIDEATQTIHFDAIDAARVPRKVGKISNPDDDETAPEYDANAGAVLNYSLNYNVTNSDSFSSTFLNGLSGAFDARLFSKYGVLKSGFLASATNNDYYSSTRLNTNWTYSDPQNMRTYVAGDLITGGLSWTRPVRLGGAQIQRNFRLRPSLITIPIPDIRGSAAVPSTVEVYANNLKRHSENIGPGPFEVVGIPLSNGPGTVQIVVRDQFGQETVEEVPVYTSSKMLKPGLFDYSVSGGFPRRDFGLKTDTYDHDFMASGSIRYGLTNNLTVEGHVEGGKTLLMGGASSIINLGKFGIGTANIAASHHRDEIGYRIGGSIDTSINNWRIFASTQRALGNFNDLASVSTVREYSRGVNFATVPKSIDQISISAPLFDDGSAINFNFAHIQDNRRNRTSVTGLSYNRPFIGQSTFYANGYIDISNSKNYGFFGGLSVPFGGDTFSSGLETGTSGTRLTADYTHPLGQDLWDPGWRVQASSGTDRQYQAGASIRSPIAKFEANAYHSNNNLRGSLNMTGAIAAAGGGIFMTDQVYDSFAVVDAGAPGVPVRHQNRYLGTTNWNGKILIPNLTSLSENAIEIDPKNLPLDIDVPTTRKTVTPAQNSGVVVKFGIKPGQGFALVSFKLPNGEFVPVGAEGKLINQPEAFTIGYDGQAYIRGLSAKNSVEIYLPDTSETCHGAFTYKESKGQQVSIDNVVCQ